MINMVFLLYLTLAILSTSATASYNFIDECMNLPLILCANGGKTVLTTYNKQKSLIGWWSFDDRFAHDHSGHGLNGSPVPDVGPSYCI
jgi:hypothetical protein